MQESEVKTEKTHIRFRTIIEVLGKPKEHVEKTLRNYVDKIKDDSELVMLNSQFSDAEEKGGLWAAFAELEVVIRGIPKLISFCFDYMPSSIEIIKPEEFKMKATTIEGFLNDLQARLHQLDMMVKNQKFENEFLRKNMNTSVRNVILISLATGRLTKENLSKVTGVDSKELDIFLDKLIEEKRIKKEDKLYVLADSK